MSEIAQAFQWVAQTMTGDSALMANATGVYRELAPIDTVAPFVIVSQQAGNDMLTVNAVRIFTHLLLQIKALGPSGTGGNYAVLVTIADRIDALFKSVREVGLGGSSGVLCCYRERTIAYGELVNAQPWSHLGGLYHIQLQGA
jgi:hypothetical protein